jgi:hypothetical protein
MMMANQMPAGMLNQLNRIPGVNLSVPMASQVDMAQTTEMPMGQPGVAMATATAMPTSKEMPTVTAMPMGQPGVAMATATAMPTSTAMPTVTAMPTATPTAMPPAFL